MNRIQQRSVAILILQVLFMCSFSTAAKRSEGYFGIHLDFHAVKENDRIGENVTEEMVQQIIDAVHPDYIQVDSKGHPGYSSYPTKVGTQTDGYVKDQLKIWRKVTKANNIPLTVHYSSDYDMAAIEKNPDWAFVKHNGSKDKKYLSLFSPFASELMIPQIKELRSEYGVDAVWLDGECWGVQVDYSPEAVKAFKEKYGDVKIPAGPSDQYYSEYLEMLRQKFRDYVAGYLSELHGFDDGLEIASNWAYSTYMPEKCELDLDWLSGDLPAANSVNAARVEARFLRSHRKNWDLMAWGFYHHKNSLLDTKTSLQLMQEAASVISQGGGFQVYYTQRTDGSVRQWQIDKLADVAKFCRDRQKYCHDIEPVVQTAVLLSSQGMYDAGLSYRRVFGPWGDKETGGIAPISGVSQALCDSQVAFEIMTEDQIIEHLNTLKLIVVPQWPRLADEFKQQLISFTDKGGSLLIIGPQAAKLFEKELGVSFTSEVQRGTRWLGFGDSYACFMNNEFASVKPGDHAKVIGDICPFERTGCMSANLFMSLEDKSPAATIKDLGKGQIAGVYLNFGENYVLSKNCGNRDFLKSIVDELLPEPLVKVTGSHNVDVVLNKVGGDLAVNLINTSGPHANNAIPVFDEIPAVGPLTVSIRTDGKPVYVVMQPGGTPLECLRKEGYCVVEVPRFDIYKILTVREK